MSEENKPRPTLWERLQASYKLIIQNTETFEEIATYRLTLLNAYILGSVLFVLVAALVVALLVLTPAKRYIPGYGDVYSNPVFLKINRQLDSLETLLEAHQTYTEAFRRMLTNEVELPPDRPPESLVHLDSLEEVPLAEEDLVLRNEFELESIREVAQNRGPDGLGFFDIPLEQLYFVPPVKGEISAGFMPEKRHFGVDVIAPKNTPVKAVLDGYVIASDWTLETGNTIGIQHANNIVTFYKHNSMLLKKVGDRVKAGEAVAIIGNTGDLSDGPHLHFELWHRGKPVNPEDFINFF